MKTMYGAVIVATLAGGPALAQQTHARPLPDVPPASTPNPYGGGPDYGVARRGPDGQICVTTPSLIGKPQYGTTTTCYPDAAQAERSPAGGEARPDDGPATPTSSSR